MVTLFKTLFKRTPQSRFLFFLISDILLIISSVPLSFLIRFDFTIPSQYHPHIPYYIGIALIVVIPFLHLKHLYHFTWIYVSLNTLISLAEGTAYAFLFLTLLLFLGRNHILANSLPRSIILINYVSIFFLLGGLRISKRLFFEFLRWQKRTKNATKPQILIIGAGDAAEQLIRSISQNREYPFEITGLLDDNDIKQNTTIHGIPVLGYINDLPKLKKLKDIYGIIIALPSATATQIDLIITLAHEADIRYTKILPTLSAFIDHRVTIKDVRDINVEDLLGREKIHLSLTEIEHLIKNKTILITGAAGSIGEELVTQVSKFQPQKLIGIDIDETRLFEIENRLRENYEFLKKNPHSFHSFVGSILDKEKIGNIFATYHPHIVFHAAAYKHVGMMESTPDEATKTNILGTWNLAEAAKKHGTEKFVLISTDKAVNPTSVMGMSKRIAEMLVGQYNNAPNLISATKYIAVRFGNVLGSRGSVVPIFKKQIMSGGPVTITHKDMQRYFMVPSEAILLILQAAFLGRGGEIFFLDMGNPVKILDLAETMIRMAGFKPYKDIPIIFTKSHKAEKLYEMLRSDTEKKDATKHKKIFIAKSDTMDSKSEFFQDIQILIEFAQKGKNEEVKRLMQEIINRK